MDFSSKTTMFPSAISNSTSMSEEASISSGTKFQDFPGLNPPLSITPNPQQYDQKIKKKKSLPGNPDPEAEVIALSPKTLLATNRFVCEICRKGFQRDQNLQLHRRGHNLPWKLKQRNSQEIRKKAYVCPEPSCVHHHPSRALGDLTGIKKHFSRKHGEKKWKCEKCSKIYAVQSDWKAHSKTCGTREYRCDCGTVFSRKDSFITHRAFCDALAEESARLTANQIALTAISAAATTGEKLRPLFPFSSNHHFQHPNPSTNLFQNPERDRHLFQIPPITPFSAIPTTTTATAPIFFPLHAPSAPAALSATALLRKAAAIGTALTASGHITHGHLDIGEFGRASQINPVSYISPEYNLGGLSSTWQASDHLTRDFLGLTSNGDEVGNEGDVDVSISIKDILTYTGRLQFEQYEQDQSMFKPHHGYGLAEPAASETWADC